MIRTRPSGVVAALFTKLFLVAVYDIVVSGSNSSIIQFTLKKGVSASAADVYEEAYVISTAHCALRCKADHLRCWGVNVESGDDGGTVCGLVEIPPRAPEGRPGTLHYGRKLPKDCQELVEDGITTDGVFPIELRKDAIFQVYCELSGTDAGWTVLMRRAPADVHISFDREWDDYKNGFGNLSSEFWLGLDKMHLLTQSAPIEMQIDAEDFEGETKNYRYSSFTIADEADNYRLDYGGYVGTEEECLGRAKGSPFTSADRDNDKSGDNCATKFKGGWWHDSCHAIQLNGVYHGGPHTSFADGININCFRGHRYSLKYASIKIRPQ